MRFARLHRLDDRRLATLVHAGHGAAFETLYDRHHAALLAFCRHMLGNREDGEDALQQTFLRAHRALRAGAAPEALRAWLFAIARNRCRTLMAARREAAVPVEELEPSFDGLAEDVRRRADLRELVADLARLPEDQRGALVLAELGDLSHTEIAAVIGCPAAKVKALVFQARTALIADRDARGVPCEDIRGQLETARAGALRRGPLRRHLRQCEPCRSYQALVARRRDGLAWVLPVMPSAGLKAAVLGSASGSGTAAAGGALAIGGGVKALLAAAALTTVAGAGLVGGGDPDPPRAAAPKRTEAAKHSGAPQRTGAPRALATPEPVRGEPKLVSLPGDERARAPGRPGGTGGPTEPGEPSIVPRLASELAPPSAPAAPRTRPPRRHQTLAAFTAPHARSRPMMREAEIRARRRPGIRRAAPRGARRRDDSAAPPGEVGAPADESERPRRRPRAEPPAEEPSPRRPRGPELTLPPAPTPAPTLEPAPEPTPTPTPEPTPEPTPTPTPTP